MFITTLYEKNLQAESHDSRRLVANSKFLIKSEVISLISRVSE